MESESRMLNMIREGMPVFDAQENRIGTVETVFPGGIRDDAIELGSSLADSPAVYAGEPNNWLALLKEVFDPVELPREMIARLLNDGYVIMDGEGLLAADRIIMPEQISSVGAGGVHLNTMRNNLPRP